MLVSSAMPVSSGMLASSAMTGSWAPPAACPPLATPTQALSNFITDPHQANLRVEDDAAPLFDGFHYFKHQRQHIISGAAFGCLDEIGMFLRYLCAAVTVSSKARRFH